MRCQAWSACTVATVEWPWISHTPAVEGQHRHTQPLWRLPYPPYRTSLTSPAPSPPQLSISNSPKSLRSVFLTSAAAVSILLCSLRSSPAPAVALRRSPKRPAPRRRPQADPAPPPAPPPRRSARQRSALARLLQAGSRTAASALHRSSLSPRLVRLRHVCSRRLHHHPGPAGRAAPPEPRRYLRATPPQLTPLTRSRCFERGRGNPVSGPTVACEFPPRYYIGVVPGRRASPRLSFPCVCAARGTQFVLSRDELLTLPEFVLLSMFPNGLFPDGQVNSFHEDGIYIVDVCFFYDFFFGYRTHTVCGMGMCARAHRELTCVASSLTPNACSSC